MCDLLKRAFVCFRRINIKIGGVVREIPALYKNILNKTKVDELTGDFNL